MAIPGQEQLDSLLQLLRGEQCGGAGRDLGVYRRPGCLRLRAGIVKNRADAEDVVNESLVKLARGVRGYKSGTNGCAFVMRIVRNCAFDLLRRRKVRRGRGHRRLFSTSRTSGTMRGRSSAPSFWRMRSAASLPRSAG